MKNKLILETRDLGKIFATPSGSLKILENLSFELAPGETLSITGPSGSGKSTLLGLLAGLDRPTTGQIFFDGKDLSQWDEDGLSLWRRDQVGFIFQNFRLIPTLSCVENTALPLELQGIPWKEARRRATEELARLDLLNRADHFPSQLSGGEQQRTAIARAYIHEPRLIFADEPTGSLDRNTAKKVLDTLLETNLRKQTALIVVTHDPEVAKKMNRRLSLAKTT